MNQSALSVRDLLVGMAAAKCTISTMAEIIDSVPSFVYWKGTDLRYLGANKNFLFSLGCTAGHQVVGRSDSDFLTKDQTAASLSIDSKVLRTGEPILDQVELRTAIDGSARQLRTSRFAFRDEDGAVIGLFGIAEEVRDEHASAAELRTKARQLAEYAALDELTGLPNRRSLNRALTLMLAEADAFTLLFIDLDGFKVINDSLGHEVGDRVVQSVGKRLLETVPQAGLIARLGGDEFAILITGAEVVESEEIAETVVLEFRKPILVDDLDLYCSASVGLAKRAIHHTEPAHLLRDSDLAMYAAKANGRDRYEIFSPEMFKVASEGLYMRNRVARAVRDRDFKLFYQPIFDSDRDRVSGVEALLRMPTADRKGMEPAGRFLPHLEQTGLILPVGEWIVEQACEQLAAWQNDYRVSSNLSINVNLSPLQLGSGGLSGMILHTIAAHGLRPQRLTIEMTETAVADNRRNVRANLEHLRAEGVKVAMDDFGVGQSSLALLGNLPFDIVKIDKQFVKGIGDPRREQLLLGVIRMIETLGLTAVAEGVETEEQFDWLKAQGCRYLQGYYIGHPSDPAEIDAL